MDLPNDPHQSHPKAVAETERSVTQNLKVAHFHSTALRYCNDVIHGRFVGAQYLSTIGTNRTEKQKDCLFRLWWKCVGCPETSGRNSQTATTVRYRMALAPIGYLILIAHR
jgi:hypothetical protein